MQDVDWSKRPPHSHYFKLRSEIALAHTHIVPAFVYAVNGNGTDGHFHDYQGHTLRNHGHFHRFYGRTGPAIPLPNGSHYHAISDFVNNEPFEFKGSHYRTVLTIPRHVHAFSGMTGPAIAYEPENW